VFNLSGSEIFFLLLIGLVVLGPEKLPEAMRKFGRVYNEVRKVAGGMQTDLRRTFEDPVNEFRKTTNQARRLISGESGPTPEIVPTSEASEPIFIPYEPLLPVELTADVDSNEVVPPVKKDLE